MSSDITRKKGQSGRAVTVECVQCGKKIPRDKAVERHKKALPLDLSTRRLLKKSGAWLPHFKRQLYYCIACAKHRGYI
ncbi:MAG: 30S ribosomal protein S26e [Candidatus Bathyarchaeia archaeon]